MPKYLDAMRENMLTRSFGSSLFSLLYRLKSPLSEIPKMADYVPLSAGEERERIEDDDDDKEAKKETKRRSPRLASLDVFRGLCIVLMIYVDYAGSLFPSIAHSPWDGLQLADFVTPFFLFIVGISLSLVYKRAPNRYQQSHKAMLRALKLFLLGVFLQA